MSKASSPRYWDDWRLFCENATDAQLPNIIIKEEEAGRYAEATIAQAVLDGRRFRISSRCF